MRVSGAEAWPHEYIYIYIYIHVHSISKKDKEDCEKRKVREIFIFFFWAVFWAVCEERDVEFEGPRRGKYKWREDLLVVDLSGKRR